MSICSKLLIAAVAKVKRCLERHSNASREAGVHAPPPSFPPARGGKIKGKITGERSPGAFEKLLFRGCPPRIA